MGERSRIRRARELRTNMTGCERKLWSVLRTLRHSHGLHVRRQVPIGRYIADFACHARKLIIEVDGDQHGGAADERRDAWFATTGYRTLRFSNWQVVNEWDGVVRKLVTELRLESSPHPDPPLEGEGD